MSVRLPTPAEVDTARANIAGVARRTPLWRLDAPTPPGVTIWLKLENLQPLGSFKLRAGVNALKSKDPAALKPKLDALLTRYHLEFELRGESKEELSYEVRTPSGAKTDRLSERILRLDPDGVTEVAWEDKKEKK